MNWEQALREALRRCEPPTGFAERVLERVGMEAGVSLRRRRRPWLRWVAVAASLTLLVAGGYQYREHRVRVRGEQARDELLEALRVTETKLKLVREHINRTSGVPHSETTQESRI
ncbi:MAG: hypothetical protein K6T59_06300 [Bryobacteraceae bacterium]|jgi:hypothetical protein|nr:hypothetical protein [Bryobacteraceae bacterium]